ncbi:MAG: TonB-dependent receptor plug domain-containing protein [Bacteroidales bacterium]|nr:TonB-dependent receptor plug domain-containing protein [Bacteroidales bacterium]
MDFNNTQLNKALRLLIENYGIELSFDDRALSEHNVNISGSFNSFDELLDELLRNTGYDFEKTNNIYLIFPSESITEEPETKYLLSGSVVDVKTREALPFTHVSVNDNWIVTDFKGNFSYSSVTDSIFDLKVSYLGYYILDTVLYQGIHQIISLEPSNIEIKEILVKYKKIEKSIQAGSGPGVLRLNQQISSYLPGNGDNSVFNLLRLQPGILAAGEQSSDMIIWGSYEGHSQVSFDGFTIFGLRNYNDNISSVNPYMAKDIKIMKGGFGSEYGERVGGIVDITGIDGNKNDPSLNLSINNMTLSGLASVPLFNKAAVVVGFRHTYYDLYDNSSLDFLDTRSKNSRSGGNADVNVYPDYMFRDMNIKVSGTGDNGDSYFLSLFAATDEFAYSVEEDSFNQYIFNKVNENNLQQGASLFYGKKWNNGGITNIKLSYSYLNRKSSEIRELLRGQHDRIIFNMDRDIDSEISEMGGTLHNIFSQGDNFRLEFGTGLTYNMIRHREDTFNVDYVNMENSMLLPKGFFKGIFSYRNLEVKTGLRLNYPTALNKLYIQPRISAGLKINNSFRINASWGIYNQFYTRSSVIDENGNYNYLWVICDNEDIPVLDARHYVAGLSWSKSNTLISLDGYYKNTKGITRYVQSFSERTIYQGDSRSRGLDILIKKDYKGHSAWVSYSLGKTEEYFPYFEDDDYRRALHDQRHEFKIAGIIDLKPAYFSANYVYGSGFPDPLNQDTDLSDDYDYSRLDLALVFRFSRKGSEVEAGLSVLNAFNTENIKYSNFVRFPSDQTETIDLHAEAVPRTFTVFLNLSF